MAILVVEVRLMNGDCDYTAHHWNMPNIPAFGSVG
jgi:hypothetical protein